MPLKKAEDKGTNADGSKSHMYCTHCYQQGNFTHPEYTVSQMQEHVKGIMKSMGFPGFLAVFFTKGIPKLERWKK